MSFHFSKAWLVEHFGPTVDYPDIPTRGGASPAMREEKRNVASELRPETTEELQPDVNLKRSALAATPKYVKS